MVARNEEVPEHRRMLFRIGINLGDVIHDEARIYGDGINVAARLEGLAEPGSSSRKRSTTRCATVSTWPLRIWASAN
jgi:class 3 adenylate cyclase